MKKIKIKLLNNDNINNNNFILNLILFYENTLQEKKKRF